jgi:hypothetical protein
MTNIRPQILAQNPHKTLSILKSIIEHESSSRPLIDHPVLIGSHAAKWHIASFRKPKDWDLVATPSQSTLFITKVTSNATLKDIKLIYYPGAGLKIVGSCVHMNNDTDQLDNTDDKSDHMDDRSDNTDDRSDHTDEDHTDDMSNNMDNTGNSIYFDIELVSDKMDLGKMKSNEVELVEFEKLNSNQQKMSAQMILEICRDIKDKIVFPLADFLCIVAPLKVLEALKSSHIYWPIDFHKNISDLHSLRGSSGYTMNQPLNLQRDEKIELMLKTRIKETEMRQGIPGAHINLNKTNEEFLDREDDLFVQRRIPHDELHERVKYGDHPIHETLKEDKV